MVTVTTYFEVGNYPLADSDPEPLSCSKCDDLMPPTDLIECYAIDGEGNLHDVQLCRGCLWSGGSYAIET